MRSASEVAMIQLTLQRDVQTQYATRTLRGTKAEQKHTLPHTLVQSKTAHQLLSQRHTEWSAELLEHLRIVFAANQCYGEFPLALA